MTTAARPPRAPLALAVLVLALAPAPWGCKGQSPPPATEGKGVMEGGKARSAPGRTLEDAKQQVEGAQDQLQKRSDDVFERSAGEKAERGAP